MRPFAAKRGGRGRGRGRGRGGGSYLSTWHGVNVVRQASTE